jgi:diguanylate cyclase (GGDEF)-like protein
MTHDFERDDATGLWKWPVVLSPDWSKWPREPCAILWGQGSSDERVIETVCVSLLSSKWPRLLPFKSEFGFLIVAPNYSQEQALLLAEDVNRQLGAIILPLRPYYRGHEPRLTWGISLAEKNWDVSTMVAQVVGQAQEAEEKGRFGSINFCEDETFDPFEEVAIFAGHDPLTRLWNRSLVALQARDANESIALLMGDIDSFREVNDVFGQNVGDVVLQTIGEILRGFESKNVAASHVGGDEFMLWTRGLSLQSAQEMAQQINDRIKQQKFNTEYGATPFSGLSLTWGVIAATPSDFQLPAMMRRADELIHAAKHERRGSVSAEML